MTIRDVCLLPVPDYEPPTHAEVRELIYKHGLIVADYGAMVGVGPRAARYWCSPLERGGRIIPYAPWRLSLILLGEVKPEQRGATSTTP